jgi:hypothetical protein
LLQTVGRLKAKIANTAPLLRSLAQAITESQPPASAIVIVIVDFKFQHCANPGEAVEHRGNERRLMARKIALNHWKAALQAHVYSNG